MAALGAVNAETAAPLGMWTDDALASSAVLAEAGIGAAGTGEPVAAVVVRHVLALPVGRVAAAADTARLDDYVVGQSRDGDPDAGPGLVPLVLERVLVVDARTLSQERSRMASLASRSGGGVIALVLLR